MKIRGRVERIVRSLLFRRFETAELILSLSLLVHGLWLLLPGWSVGGSPTLFSRPTEIITAWLMTVAGAAHAPVVIHNWGSDMGMGIRHPLSMSSFVGHAYLLMLVIFTVGGTSVFVIPYVALTLLSGLAYLSMTLVNNE